MPATQTTPTDYFSTGENTPNHVIWTSPFDFPPPGQFPTTSTPLTLPRYKPQPDETNKWAGQWNAEAWLDPQWGLSLKNIEFLEDGWTQAHVLAESVQWRNIRLIFKDGHEEPVNLASGNTSIVVMRGGGVRIVGGKMFAWGIAAYTIVGGIEYPASSGIVYDVNIHHDYLVAEPESDQDPAGAVLAIKVFPLLTVSVSSPSTPTAENPSVAADLKMVHAPRIVRNSDPTTGDKDGERRSDGQYKDLSDGTLKKDAQNVFAYLVCDTNDDTRPAPGNWLNAPQWDYMFDYANPRVRKELVFDAVVFEDTPSSPQSFTINYSGAGTDLPSPGLLKCIRQPRQGEYDNLHISPYLGFDVPGQPDSETASTYPFVEAPLAADEIVHLHWRWGTAAASRAVDGVGTAFKGWSDLEPLPSPPGSRRRTTAPNAVPGRPLIPANQGLKIGLALDNSEAPPSGQFQSFDNAQRIAVWYLPIAHFPALNQASQFFGQGFSLAYHFNPDSVKKWLGLVHQDNWELLRHAEVLNGFHYVATDPNLASALALAIAAGLPYVLLTVPGYHELRWNGDKQRVPNADADPTLTVNMTGLPTATHVTSYDFH